MKRLVILLLCAASLAISTPLLAQETSIVINQDEHSIFKGLFRSVWSRLKSLNPTAKQSAKATQVYTAGIRGAEATDTLLSPYWKDDLTQDEDFQAELENFSLAQIKMDQGDLEAAVESFDGFLDQYGQSDLRPNALFGKSISLAGLGQMDQSLQAMQLFVDENPNHPMVDDARQVIVELQ